MNSSCKSWDAPQNWDAISPIFKFSTIVRKVIYTTNAIENLNAYVVLGINEDGYKEVLTIAAGENESSRYWPGILNSLQNCGVLDILILCSNGLTGLEEAVQTSFLATEQQRCIVHMVRNTLKYVANKDMKAFAKDLKTIYTAPDEESARFPPIFKSLAEVGKVFYTTNAIESLNSSYWRLNRQRSVFPSPQSLLKAVLRQTIGLRHIHHK